MSNPSDELSLIEVRTSINHDEPDHYSDVPHNGEHFVENGQVYYWNFSNVKPGTRYKTKNKAWVTTGPTEQAVGELQEHPLFPGATPVIPVLIHVPGFYYETDNDVTAVENQSTPQGQITKWRVDNPISTAQQTYLAWNSSSVEEYEAKKQAMLAT